MYVICIKYLSILQRYRVIRYHVSNMKISEILLKNYSKWNITSQRNFVIKVINLNNSLTSIINRYILYIFKIIIKLLTIQLLNNYNYIFIL